MTKHDMVLAALEAIINERGKLRAAGMEIDTLPHDLNVIIDAAKAAHQRLKSKSAKAR